MIPGFQQGLFYVSDINQVSIKVRSLYNLNNLDAYDTVTPRNLRSIRTARRVTGEERAKKVVPGRSMCKSQTTVKPTSRYQSRSEHTRQI